MATHEADIAYLQKHNVPQLMNTLLKEVFAERPANPAVFMLESLRRKRAEREEQLQADKEEATAQKKKAKTTASSPAQASA
jgi:hypothetical protein